MLKFHCIAVVGDGPQVILMLVEGQIEKPWKMMIQSYASKEGIGGDMNSKVGPRFRVSMSWEKLEDLQIQWTCSHFGEQETQGANQSTAEPLFYALKDYLKLNSLGNALELDTLEGGKLQIRFLVS